jgi:alcohol dehydrogenase class IV
MIGLDSINMLGSELNFEEGKKILIVTDEGVRNAGIVDKITANLKSMGLIFEIYDKVEPDPHIEIAKNIAARALGGGSPMDTAKVASFSVANPGNIENYLLEA